MAGPGVLKKDLRGESMAGVETLISTYMNDSDVETPLAGPCRNSVVRGNTVTASQGQATNPCQGHNYTSESQICPLQPREEEEKKYKLCTIEQGALIIPEEKVKVVVEKECGAFVKDGCDFKIVECEDVPDDDVVTSEPIASESEKNIPPNVHKTKHVPGSENTQNYKAYNSYASEPKVERLDNDVMNKLLDYYRKFNERQLGLTVDEEAPGYKQSTEPPAEIMCDNDIIKEAVIRVGQSQDAGEVVKEPTIVDSSPPVNEKLAKLYSQAHVGIDMTEENLEAYCDELSSKNWRYSDHYESKDGQNYDEQWIYGANFIEKALQKRIDDGRQGRTNNKKWDQDDLVKLVEMLSKKRTRGGRKNERGWSTGSAEPIYEDCRDDLLYKIDELNGQMPQEDQDTLFMRLKREPANNDQQDLRNVVNENSYRYRSSRPVSRRRQVYYGGDELIVAMEMVKNVINLSWLWSAYDTVVGRWFERNQNDSRETDDEDYDDDDDDDDDENEDECEKEDNKWFRWTISLNRVKSLTGWLSSIWRFGRVGKPIYKQVEYQDTDLGSWRTRYANDVENCSMVKNRKMRNIPEETVVEFHPNLYYSTPEATFPQTTGLPRAGPDRFSEEGSHLPDVIRQARRTDRDCIVTMDA